MQRMTRLRWMAMGAAVFAGALMVALAVGLTQATAQVFPPAEQTLPESYFYADNRESRGFVQPLPTMEAVRTFVLVDGTKAITQTLVSDSPLLDRANRDASATTGYASADVFISAVGEGDDWTLGAIVEMSADRVHWAQLACEYYNSYVVDAMPVGRTLTADDDTVYQQVQLAGAFMRVRLQPTGTVTPTVTVTYRRAGNASE